MKRIAWREFAGRRSFVLPAFLLGLVFWLADAAFHASLFHGEPFLDAVLCPNGEHLWMRLVAAAFCSVIGGLAALLVARRRRLEAELRASERRLRSLIESSGDGILAYDTEIRVTLWNPAMQGITGIRAEEMLGRSLFEEFPFLHEVAEGNAFGEAIRGKSSVQSAMQYRVPERGHKGYFESAHFPLYDAQGQIVGGMGIIRDVTERKQAERARRLRELQQAAVAELGLQALRAEDPGDLMQEAVIRVAETLGVEFCEVLELLPDGEALLLRAGVGWSQGLVGRATVESGENSQAGYTLLSRAPVIVKNLRTERRFCAPALLRDHGVSSGLSVVIQGHDHPFGVLGAHTTERRVFTRDDVNFLQSVANVLAEAVSRRRTEEERRRLSERVQQAQKAESLGVLAGGIAHDFNNLLMGVLGNAELVLHDLSPASAIRTQVEEIEGAARQAAELCRQMLAYSGRGKFVVRPIALNEVVEETAQLLESSVSKKAALEYHFGDRLPAIEADATQIRQVVMNLITNAVEAIEGESGVITIATGVACCDAADASWIQLSESLPGRRCVYLEVADTGCGMDPETARKIFDPFFTTKFTGRGLGLAAVAGIVRGHRGGIAVETEPGRGTRFRVLFPGLDRPAEPVCAESATAPEWCGSGTVLLVDDEEVVRRTASRMLERAGLSVLTATEGREAVEVYRKHADRIVCVILDLTMPRMGGEETLRALRQVRSDVRVIASSGYSEQELMDRFGEDELVGFIEKPYRFGKLVEKLSEVLSGPNLQGPRG